MGHNFTQQAQSQVAVLKVGGGRIQGFLAAEFVFDLLGGGKGKIGSGPVGVVPTPGGDPRSG